MCQAIGIPLLTRWQLCISHALIVFAGPLAQDHETNLAPPLRLPEAEQPMKDFRRTTIRGQMKESYRRCKHSPPGLPKPLLTWLALRSQFAYTQNGIRSGVMHLHPALSQLRMHPAACTNAPVQYGNV